jgi:hypothetical protein
VVSSVLDIAIGTLCNSFRDRKTSGHQCSITAASYAAYPRPQDGCEILMAVSYVSGPLLRSHGGEDDSTAKEGGKCQCWCSILHFDNVAQAWK